LCVEVVLPILGEPGTTFSLADAAPPVSAANEIVAMALLLVGGKRRREVFCSG